MDAQLDTGAQVGVVSTFELVALEDDGPALSGVLQMAPIEQPVDGYFTKRLLWALTECAHRIRRRITIARTVTAGG